MSNLSELFRTARQYGLVNLFSHDDNTYNAKIKFQTIPGVMLEAQSGFHHETPERAVQASIDKAVEILNSLAEQSDKLKRLTSP